MEYERIKYKPGKVTQIIMNRPECMNALSHPHYRELEDAFTRAADDPECRVIVLSGEGRCFSSGHDTDSVESRMYADGTPIERPAEFEQMSKEAAWVQPLLDVRRWKEHAYYAYEIKMRKWRFIPKPTIAMVHGYCIFGAFLTAAAMDLVFASEDALFLPTFGQDIAGPWDWGPRKAKEIYFEHRFIPAREAYECGFVSRIYPTREILEKETLAYANRVADNMVPRWVADFKQGINQVMDAHGYSAGMDIAWGVLDRLIHTRTEAEVGQQHSGGRISMGRVSLALDNLKAKLESENVQLPSFLSKLTVRKK